MTRIMLPWEASLENTMKGTMIMNTDQIGTVDKDCEITVVDNVDKGDEYHVRGLDGLKRLLDRMFYPEQRIGSKKDGSPLVLEDAINELVAALDSGEPTDIDEAMGLSISMRSVPAPVAA